MALCMELIVTFHVWLKNSPPGSMCLAKEFFILYTVCVNMCHSSVFFFRFFFSAFVSVRVFVFVSQCVCL